MNTKVLKELEQQITEVIGMVALATYGLEDGNTSDEAFWINNAKARLIGLRQGLGIIINNACENDPMTLGELQQAQFNKAKEVDHDEAIRIGT